MMRGGRGKPIAENIPVDTKEKDIPLKGTVTFLGDTVAEDDWRVQK
jgi:hypothetical protein